MEKFTNWRDPFTGIHPFLPYNSGVGSLIVGVLVLLVKLPFLVVLFPIVLILDALLSFVPIVRRVVNAVLGRVLLFVLGVVWVDNVLVGRLEPRSNTWICNHKSYLDPLVLATHVGPLRYFFLYGDRAVVCSTLLQAIIQSIGQAAPQNAPLVSSFSVADFSSSIVFAEGTSSNHEKCILKMSTSLPPNMAFSFLLLSYPSPLVAYLGSPPSPFLKHFLVLLSALWIRPRLHRAAPAQDEQPSQTAERVAAATGYRVLKLDYTDKQNFCKFYREEQNR